MTALARILDRLPPEHREPFLRLVNEAGLREDSPDLHILALEHEARWGAVEAMRAERQRITGLLADIPGAMRAAAVPIVEGLASDTVAQIREDAKTTLIDLLGQALDIHEREVATLVKSQDASAKSLTTAAESAVATINERALTTGSTLLNSAEKLAGWTTVRIASVFAGVVVAGVIAATSALGAGYYDRHECDMRTHDLGVRSHYDPHQQNLLRRAACGD